MSSEEIGKREELENALKEAYLELGKEYYEGGFEDPLPQLLSLFDKITRLKKKIEEVEDTQTDTGRCPGCGAVLEPGNIFCGRCGRKIG